jgi:hypothetical protein
VADSDEEKSPPAAPAPLTQVPVITLTAPSADSLSFRAFIQEKVPQYKCPICGNSSYNIMQFFDPNIPAITTLFTANTNSFANVPYYTMFGIGCTNCGNIQLFYQTAVEEWARTRAGASETKRNE